MFLNMMPLVSADLTLNQTFILPPSHFLFLSADLSVNVNTSGEFVFSCPERKDTL